MTDYQITYYKRLGWPYKGDPLKKGCKVCGEPSLHTKQGWFTRDCKPVMIPDQWEDAGYGDYEPLPPEFTDDDVTLMKPWDERPNDEILNDIHAHEQGVEYKDIKSFKDAVERKNGG